MLKKFYRRIYETISTQKFTRATSSFEVFGGAIYYGLFGAAIGYQNNYYLPESIKMWLGIEFWIIGEYGNFYHHKLLGSLRKDQTDKKASEVRKNNTVLRYLTKFGLILLIKQKKDNSQAGSRWQIPQGGLFSLVSCPHYFFEVVSWLGFAVASGFSISST